jgi:short-subunit dehydrogenase
MMVFMDSLRGQVAAITGASSGIGAALARALAAEGVAVGLAARREDRLHRVAAEIQAAGGRALGVPADVAVEADVRGFITRTLTVFGRLDVVVCNAGIGFYGTLDDTPAETAGRLLEVNVLGTFYAARAALPHFDRQGHGHLVIVSSIQGRRAAPYSGMYAATKFAQAGLAEALRAEYAGTNVHVSLVCPVSTDTEFRQAMSRTFGVHASQHGPQQSAETVARAIVRALRRPRPEVYPYRLARLLTIANALAPALTDRLVRRYGRKKVA